MEYLTVFAHPKAEWCFWNPRKLACPDSRAS
jgi:hypothetical protein